PAPPPARRPHGPRRSPPPRPLLRRDGDDPAVVAARARDLGKLALPRGAGHRDALHTRRDSRDSSATRSAAAVSRLRGLGALHRTNGRNANRGGLHELLVGHPVAPALRDTRGAST